MKKEKISIIVPVYNVEQYLKKCLDSIINQTYKNFEIILIDDGSKDDSGIICDEYKNIDNRIKVIHQKNKGLSGARNTGLKNITGNYITFIDSDDYVEKDYIEFLYKLIKEDDYDISACNCYKIVNNKKEENITEEKYIFNSEDALYNLFDINSYFTQSAWGKLYKRDLFNNNQFPEGKIYEDIETIGNILLRVNKIIYSTLPKYNYYIRLGSLSYSDYSIKELDRINNSKKLVNKSIKKYPKLKTIANIFYISNLIAVCNKQLFIGMYNTEEIKETKKIILNNLNIFFNKKLSMTKKIQILLFLINSKMYLKVYLNIKKDKYY